MTKSAENRDPVSEDWNVVDLGRPVFKFAQPPRATVKLLINPSEEIVFHLQRKPVWWHRVWQRWLLGWWWEDL